MRVLLALACLLLFGDASLRVAAHPAATEAEPVPNIAGGENWIGRWEVFEPLGLVVDDERIRLLIGDEILSLSSEGAVLTTQELSSRRANLNLETISLAGDSLVVAGMASEVPGAARPFVARMRASDGSLLWARSIDGVDYYNPTLAVATAQGVVAATAKLREGIRVVGLNDDGTAKWGRTLTRTGNQHLRGLVPTRDGGALVLAIALGRFAAVTRLSSEGEIVWDRTFGSGEGGSSFFGAVEVDDGGFVAVGRYRAAGAAARDAWIARLGSNGDLLWQKMLGTEGEDALHAVTRTHAGEFVATGGTTSTGSGEPRTWMVTFDAHGVVGREWTIRGADRGVRGDFGRAHVASSGSDVLFASPLLHAGRVSGASPLCGITTASTPGRESHVRQMDTALETEAFIPSLKPLDVSLAARRTTDFPLCRSKPQVSPAANQIFDEYASEESVFAGKIAGLLMARRFEELDRLAHVARTRDKRFRSGASKLRAFYEAAGRSNALTALGEEGHRALLAAWRDATGSPASRIAAAWRDYSAAERIRGTGFYRSMLPRDRAAHERLRDEALAELRELEARELCDAACFDLQIRTAGIGGWSQPLEKLLRLDPDYWEAFEIATLFLEPVWGGAPGDIEKFLDRLSERTALSDAAYAMHHRRWSLESLHTEAPAPAPQWPRMRRGFARFLRAFPESQTAAHWFAASAYRVARDRKAVRNLFASPLLAWNGTVGAWHSRADYDAARAWAFAKPVDRVIDAIARGTLPASPVGVQGEVLLSDGTKNGVWATFVLTADGMRGLTVGDAALLPTRRAVGWSFPARQSIRAEDITGQAGPGVAFAPFPRVPAHVHPLQPRITAVITGDRLFIVADRVIPARACDAGGGAFLAVADERLDVTSLLGAPILDDSGALAGIVVNDGAHPHQGRSAQALQPGNILVASPPAPSTLTISPPRSR